MQAFMKNCKISNILCLIYGIMTSFISFPCLISYFTLDMLEKEVDDAGTFLDGFASVLSYIASVLTVVFGVILLVNGVIYIILCITGSIAVKKKSIKGQKINGVFKIVVSAIELIIVIPMLLSSSYSLFESAVYQTNTGISLIYMLISGIFVVFNFAIFMFSYLQIKDLRGKK